MRKGRINYGRGLHDLFWETNEQNTQTKEEIRIKEQIKALKDERNTHIQRINTIDVHIAKLESELGFLTPNDSHNEVSDNDTDHIKYQCYVKSNFIIGNSNTSAVSALETTMRNLGKHINPLILYGASGSGKTHLAHICLDQVKQEGKSVIHLSAMEFVDQLVFALSNQTEDEFRSILVECDLLIIDDLQFFTGRYGCQDELCLILDERMANGKQVIFIADERLKGLDWHNKHLASRLLSGLNVKIDLADEAMQLQILTKRLESAKLTLSQETLVAALKNTHGNGWLIEGVAKQIIDMSLQGIDITPDTLAQNLQV